MTAPILMVSAKLLVDAASIIGRVANSTFARNDSFGMADLLDSHVRVIICMHLVAIGMPALRR
jgi:hypothetical protein